MAPQAIPQHAAFAVDHRHVLDFLRPADSLPLDVRRGHGPLLGPVHERNLSEAFDMAAIGQAHGAAALPYQHAYLRCRLCDSADHGRLRRRDLHADHNSRHRPRGSAGGTADTRRVQPAPAAGSLSAGRPARIYVPHECLLVFRYRWPAHLSRCSFGLLYQPRSGRQRPQRHAERSIPACIPARGRHGLGAGSRAGHPLAQPPEILPTGSQDGFHPRTAQRR